MVTDAVPLASFLSIAASCSHVLPLLAVVWIGFSAPGFAAPLAHKGSVIISGEYDPHWSFFTITPTLTRTTGVGPALHWLVPQTHHQGGKKEQHTGKKKRPIRSPLPPSTPVDSTQTRGCIRASRN
jgi:hypothetical protein